MTETRYIDSELVYGLSGRLDSAGGCIEPLSRTDRGIKLVATVIEDARTKRESSHIGCKLRKMARTLCACVHTNAVSSSVSYTCFEHLFTMKLTQTLVIGAL